MTLLRSPWRLVATMMFLSSVLLLSGCGGKTQSSATSPGQVTISGKLTFTRIPLKSDSNGKPLGLETDPTKFLTQPAPGVEVRFVKSTEELQPDGTKTTVWSPTARVNTGTDGTYSVTITKGDKYFVEVLSRIQPTGNAVRILADPNGVNSSLPQADRPLYSLRKGLDGSGGSSLPGTVATNDAVVNFEVGLNDKWWITQESPTRVLSATLEDSGTGSRVLAIASTLMKFSVSYGSPGPGAILDLHYRRGVAEARGTYVEYNRDLTPLSYDDLAPKHYFASVRGSAFNDDAFDEGVLFPMFAKNYFISIGTTPLPICDTKFTNLAPDLALVEGLPPAMAAILLQSPYLADTKSSGTDFVDIRDLGALSLQEKSVFSAPLISALAWELSLKAASLPSPGTPADWGKLVPLTLQRFFIPSPPTDSAALPSDLVSLYSQLARFKEAKGSTETVDLSTIFTDATLTPLLQSFNISWPRPTSGPTASFLSDWGVDVNSLARSLAPFSLSMSHAVMENGIFPNVSAGEVGAARFTLTKDTAFNLSVSTSPVLGPDSQIEVMVDGSKSTYLFSSATASTRISLKGYSTTPTFHTLRVRVLSPLLRIPDTQATVHLDLAP